MIPKNWKEKAKKNQKAFQQFLNKKNNSAAIKGLAFAHEDVFKNINCLDCANCCKNHSPTFKTTDIKRISKHLKISESNFIATYLTLDNDNDLVLKTQPCAFLLHDNTCKIYSVRPSDCARYPYTNEDVLLKRKNITMANTLVCPAVSEVLLKIME